MQASGLLYCSRNINAGKVPFIYTKKYKFTWCVRLCVTRQFRILIRRQNRPGQSDSETRQRAHERSRKNQAASARERDLTVREREIGCGIGDGESTGTGPDSRTDGQAEPARTVGRTDRQNRRANTGLVSGACPFSHNTATPNLWALSVVTQHNDVFITETRYTQHGPVLTATFLSLKPILYNTGPF
jgi:hypothetical protein